MKVSIIYPHQSTKDENSFLVGLDVMEMDSEVVGCQNYVLEMVVSGIEQSREEGDTGSGATHS